MLIALTKLLKYREDFLSCSGDCVDFFEIIV